MKVIMNTKDTVFERISDIVLEYHRDPHEIIKRLINLGFKITKKGEIIYGIKSRNSVFGNTL